MRGNYLISKLACNILLSCLCCHDGPIPVVCPSCPVLAVMFWLYCPLFPVLAVVSSLSSLPCLSCSILTVLSGSSVPVVIP